MNEFHLKSFIELLPKIIRENDTVKGAIISALSGVVATRDDIKDIITEMDKRFKDMQDNGRNYLLESIKRF